MSITPERIAAVREWGRDALAADDDGFMEYGLLNGHVVGWDALNRLIAFERAEALYGECPIEDDSCLHLTVLEAAMTAIEGAA